MVIHVALASNPLTLAFEKARFEAPKNFIRLPNGQILLETVLEANFKDSQKEDLLLCLIPSDQLDHDELREVRSNLANKGLSIEFRGVPQTRSAFATLLWAAEHVTSDPLRVVPGDALVVREGGVLGNFFEAGLPYIVSASGSEERWGFLEVDKRGFLSNFEAKNPISTTIATGELGLPHGDIILELAESLLLDAQSRHPHLGEVVLMAARGRPVSVVPASEFIPLASPGDVRSFMDGHHGR